MFNEENNNENLMSSSNPGMDFMFAVSVETSMWFNRLVFDLINKYKANNIDVIPISELENCQKTICTTGIK